MFAASSTCSSIVRALLLGALGSACTTRPLEDSATDASTGSSSTSTTHLPDPTTTAAPSTATSSPDPSTSGTSGTTGTCPFLCAPDIGDGGRECDVWAQDCPSGEKCMPYYIDTDLGWISVKCTPVAPNPGQHGDPCTAEGNGLSGIDTCDIAHICWNVVEGEGTCVKFCTGSPAAPVCTPPLTACHVAQSGVLNLCLPWCDPLMQNCPAGETCVPNPLNQTLFECVADASGDQGQEYDPCEAIDACDPGLLCTSPTLAVECDPMTIGCCVRFCDTTQAGDCTGMNQECLPWYEPGMAPPGGENIGVCGIPQ